MPLTAEQLVMLSRQNRGRTPTIGMQGLMAGVSSPEDELAEYELQKMMRSETGASMSVEELREAANERGFIQESQPSGMDPYYNAEGRYIGPAVEDPNIGTSLMESAEDLGSNLYKGGRALGEGTYDTGQSLGEGAFNAQKMLEEMGESVGKQGLMDMYKNFFSGMGK